MQQAVFDAGTNVGVLARELFKGGVDASPPNPFSYHISVAKTKALIERGVPVIYEAAFQFEGVLCALDILVKHGNDWHAFEVKSTTSVKDQHQQDAALQYYVVSHCGIHIQDISIIYLNNQYVRSGRLAIHQLFTVQSVLEEAMARQEFITTKALELKKLLLEATEPSIEIGPHCFDPYECDFTNHCWMHMPKENSVFDLGSSSGWKLLAQGYHALDQIPQGYVLNNKATQQLEHHRSGSTHIDKGELKTFLDSVTFPVYFFDFETIMPGIPEFEQSRPYQKIPFQFSLHVLRHRQATLSHHEFLGDGISDPRPTLIEAMIQLLGKSGSIVCYNMSFEKTCIKELAEAFPLYATELLAINDRIIDLMLPFQHRWYYHPNFKGSYSIKAVLPVMVPALHYNQLEIQEGTMASLVYSQLKLQDEEIKSNQRAQLLAYCKMDTLAMVKILEQLEFELNKNSN